MSCLRLATPGHPVVLVDLGPGSALGHTHDGGQLASGTVVVGQSGDPATWHNARQAEYQRRHKARKAVS